METPPTRPREHHHTKPGKSIDQLTQAERSQFVATAISERDAFVRWATHQKDVPQKDPNSFGELWRHAPSKNLLIATLGGVGLANIGLTIAADKIGLSSEAVYDLWGSTFGGPVLEELVFRSRKIPDFISWAGKKIGIPVRPDAARIATGATFVLAHGPLAGYKASQMLSLTGDAAYFQKQAHERGLAASVVAHSLFNANIYAFRYFINRLQNKQNISPLNFGDNAALKKMILSKFDSLSVRESVPIVVTGLSTLATTFVMGIDGIREVVDDHRIHDVLRKMRSMDSVSPLDDQQISPLTDRLLSYPSTHGYKFQAGVELAYTGAFLSMPDSLSDDMTPELYARSRVHAAVSHAWKDPKTLVYRLAQADSYITQRLATTEKRV